MSASPTVPGEINAELLRVLLAEQFPQWGSLPISPILPGGHDNRSFRLGESLMVRLPSRRAYAAHVAVEYEWLPRLASDLPLAIPAPVAMAEPTLVFPWPWSVYRWIEGDTLRATESPDLLHAAVTLGDFLKALHAIDPGGGPAAGEQSFGRGGPLARYDEEVSRALNVLAPVVDCDRADAIWKRALAEHWGKPPVWVHGDIAPSNLLCRGGRLAAVIDWGQCSVGDPACDLAIAWTTFDGTARHAFRGMLPLDAATWERGAGWALWKALIVLAGLPGTDPSERLAAHATLGALLDCGSLLPSV